MGEAGKRRLRETFSVDMMVERYEQLFRRLAEAQRQGLDPSSPAGTLDGSPRFTETGAVCNPERSPWPSRLI